MTEQYPIDTVEESELFRCHPSGIMSEVQIEAALYSYFVQAALTRDRRGSTTRQNVRTGLPESGSALLPNHKAVTGAQLALGLIMPPKRFASLCVQTDDLPENASLTKKHVLPLAQKDVKTWTDDEIHAVNTNAELVKRVVHRLAQNGWFVTKPQIDEVGGELGTTHLAHDDDRMTMGFSITYEGLQRAQRWCEKHPKFMKGPTTLESLGADRSQDAPEWLKAQERHCASQI